MQNSGGRRGLKTCLGIQGTGLPVEIAQFGFLKTQREHHHGCGRQPHQSRHRGNPPQRIAELFQRDQAFVVRGQRVQDLLTREDDDLGSRPADRDIETIGRKNKAGGFRRVV